MKPTDKQAAKEFAANYLDDRWDESWPNTTKEFECVALDFAISVEAAIDDCWHDYRKELVARYAS